MRRSLAPVAALAALCATATAGEEAVEIRSVDVAPGVHMLVGRGGNIGVSSGPDGVMLIDDQFAPLAPAIRAAVAEISAGTIRFVLNTHWHGDHTGGNEAFSGGGALVVAHDNVRRRMGSDQFMATLGRRVPASPPAALPVVTFAEGVTLHWNGDEIRVVHVPGAHTDGDAIVHFARANAIHAGDVFFAERYPFIDVDSGGSIGGMIAAVDAVLALADEDTAIIPGHGALSSREGLSGYRRVLVAARDRVRAAVAAGRGIESLVADRPLADFDAAFGGGFVDAEAFLRAVHASLAAP